METPLRTLAEAVNAWHGTLPRSGDVELAGRRVPAAGCVLHRIPPTDGARLLACIDGGSAPIADTPAFAASVNRLYCSAFRGRDIQQSPVPPVQFLSLARLVSNRFGFSLYPHADGPGPLPDARTLNQAGEAANGGANGRGRLLSLPRELGEWVMAGEAARRLERGDCIIMDGSLAVREEYRGPVEAVLEEARSKGVVVCGLSKTSRLSMEGGRPLLDYLREKYGGTAAPWYVDIGEPPSNPGPGDYHTMAVMLHRSSRWLYRLDMDAATRLQIGAEGTAEVLASLVANSADAALPGYPYALVCADRFARVRRDEATVLARRLGLMLGAGPRRMIMLNTQHDTLNKVAG